MSERPLLLLPEPAGVARANKSGRASGPAMLGAARQAQRLGPRLQELDAAFERKHVTFQSTSAGIVPEDVLVLETAGTVEEFVKAIVKIQGFEFLAEYDEEEVEPDEDFFKAKEDAHLGYTGRVYLVFSNQAAFRQLQRLWRLWQSGNALPFGLTKWRDVFALLRDIRP